MYLIENKRTFWANEHILGGKMAGDPQFKITSNMYSKEKGMKQHKLKEKFFWKGRDIEESISFKKVGKPVCRIK